LEAPAYHQAISRRLILVRQARCRVHPAPIDQPRDRPYLNTVVHAEHRYSDLRAGCDADDARRNEDGTEEVRPNHGPEA
jgi:hypothetical protein